jgi:hypothetical protein
MMRYKKFILLTLTVATACYVYFTGTVEVTALTEIYTKGSLTLYETGAPLFCCAT